MARNTLLHLASYIDIDAHDGVPAARAATMGVDSRDTPGHDGKATDPAPHPPLPVPYPAAADRRGPGGAARRPAPCKLPENHQLVRWHPATRKPHGERRLRYH